MALEEAMNYQRELRDFRERVASHLEMMAAAYIKATNIPIEECQLVVETLPNKMVYRFERRPTKREPDSLKACDSCLPDVVKSEGDMPA